MAAANKNTQVAKAPKQEAVQKNLEQNNVEYADPRTRIVDRSFDAMKGYYKDDPKTFKRIGGSVLIGGGIGATIGGVIMIASTF